MKVSRGWWAVILVLAVATFKVYDVQAWNCKGYNFRVTSLGSVQVENRSGSDEPSQEADVYVNGSKVINDARVPAMDAETGWKEFATVRVPSGDWSWKVKGESDCSDDGEHDGKKPTATPDPTVPRPTATPDPTATKKPRSTETPKPTVTDTFTDTPEPTRTKIVPSQTVNPTDTPRPRPTNTPKPDPSDTPRPNPSDTPKPKPSSTPRPKPSSTPSSMPSATPSETATQIYVETIDCECFDDLEVWAYLHIDDEAKAQLIDAIYWGNEPLVNAVEQSAVNVFVDADIQPILYAMVAIFTVLAGNLILAIYQQIKK